MYYKMLVIYFNKMYSLNSKRFLKIIKNGQKNGATFLFFTLLILIQTVTLDFIPSKYCSRENTGRHKTK